MRRNLSRHFFCFYQIDTFVKARAWGPHLSGINMSASFKTHTIPNILQNKHRQHKFLSVSSSPFSLIFSSVSCYLHRSINQSIKASVHYVQPKQPISFSSSSSSFFSSSSSFFLSWFSWRGQTLHEPQATW